MEYIFFFILLRFNYIIKFKRCFFVYVNEWELGESWKKGRYLLYLLIVGFWDGIGLGFLFVKLNRIFYCL